MLDIIQYCFVCSSLLQQTTQNLTGLTLRNLTGLASVLIRIRIRVLAYNDKAETNKKEEKKNHVTVTPPPSHQQATQFFLQI